MREYTLALVPVEVSRCHWCGGINGHTERCDVPQLMAKRRKQQSELPPYTTFEKSSVELYREHQRAARE